MAPRARTAADASIIQNAINSLPGTGGQATVTQAGSVFTVTFKTLEPLIVTTVLTGTGSISVTARTANDLRNHQRWHDLDGSFGRRQWQWS